MFVNVGRRIAARTNNVLIVPVFTFHVSARTVWPPRPDSSAGQPGQDDVSELEVGIDNPPSAVGNLKGILPYALKVCKLTQVTRPRRDRLRGVSLRTLPRSAECTRVYNCSHFVPAKDRTG